MVSFSCTDDDNHVVLRPLEGHEDCQSDYINASYINVSYLLHEWCYSNAVLQIVGIVATDMLFSMYVCILNWHVSRI